MLVFAGVHAQSTNDISLTVEQDLSRTIDFVAVLSDINTGFANIVLSTVHNNGTNLSSHIMFGNNEGTDVVGKP